jgi:hypothetical protein
MHLNHSLCKKIRRDLGLKKAHSRDTAGNATNVSWRAFAGRFRGLLMARYNGNGPQASEIRCLWPKYNTLGSGVAEQQTVLSYRATLSQR